MWGSRVSPLGFLQLAGSNEFLETVTVYVSSEVAESACVACVMNVIDCFLDCQFLKQISIQIDAAYGTLTWQDAVADRCLRLRHRGILVSIGNIFYLS